jgi:predicted ribonuclease YlaK
MKKNRNNNNNNVSRGKQGSQERSEPKLRAVRIDDLGTFDALTDNQQITFDEYAKDKSLLLHGVAGTGKTFLGMLLGLEEVLDPSYVYNQLCIVRSVVPTRNIGFLKGTDEEKIAIYELPYRLICKELFSSETAYDALKQQGNVQFISTSFIRGLTFDNAIILVDEMQNLTFHELDSIITRPGKNSKVILCGDYTQTDLDKSSDKEGIKTFMRILNRMNEFSTVEFGVDDIVRSDFVKSYIIAKLELGIT